MAGGMGGSKESAPGINPFEIIKDVIENNNNSKGGGYDTNKPKETAQTKVTTKLIFPSDIEGAEEIYEDPKLERFDEYGDTNFYYLSEGKYIQQKIEAYSDNKISKINRVCNERAKYGTKGGYDTNIEEIVDQPSQSAKDYEINSTYEFIVKLDEKIIFAKDVRQIDRKLTPKLNGVGDLILNLDASYSAKKYFETPVYVTFSALANQDNHCITRSVNGFWYDPNKLTLVKEEPESKIQNTEIEPTESVSIIFDGKFMWYHNGLNLHENLLSYVSGEQYTNFDIKIKCSSCTEGHNYPIKVDLNSYKKKHAENVKKQEKIKFNQSLAPFKSQCEEIGFKPGTDKFKNCLVEMMN
jgi:hypothetical protein